MLTINMSSGHYAARVQPEQSLRDGHAPGLQRRARRFDPDHRRSGRDDATICSSTSRRPTRPRARCTFIITNQGAEDHEFVALPDRHTPAADFPIVGVRGRTNRFDEREGPHQRGRDRRSGDEARDLSDAHDQHVLLGTTPLVCSLNGRHEWACTRTSTSCPPGSAPIIVGLGETDACFMFLDLSQAYAPEGKVTFIITNQGAEDHEFVDAADRHPRRGFPDRRVRGRTEPVSTRQRRPHQRGREPAIPR